jgi:hypothetical protein
MDKVVTTSVVQPLKERLKSLLPCPAANDSRNQEDSWSKALCGVSRRGRAPSEVYFTTKERKFKMMVLRSYKRLLMTLLLTGFLLLLLVPYGRGSAKARLSYPMGAIDIQKKIWDRSNDFSRSAPQRTTEVVTTLIRRAFICDSRNPFDSWSKIRVILLIRGQRFASSFRFVVKGLSLVLRIRVIL